MGGGVCVCAEMGWGEGAEMGWGGERERERGEGGIDEMG